MKKKIAIQLNWSKKPSLNFIYDADGRVMHMGKCGVNHGIFENFIAFFQKQAIMLAHRNFGFGE
jgi:hypothetical protein